MWDQIGTPSYMAPELWSDRAKEYDSSVDMWALGVVCYMLLSGKRPFHHQARAAATRRGHAPRHRARSAPRHAARGTAAPCTVLPHLHSTVRSMHAAGTQQARSRHAAGTQQAHSRRTAGAQPLAFAGPQGEGADDLPRRAALPLAGLGSHLRHGQGLLQQAHAKGPQGPHARLRGGTCTTPARPPDTTARHRAPPLHHRQTPCTTPAECSQTDTRQTPGRHQAGIRQASGRHQTDKVPASQGALRVLVRRN